MKRRTTAYIALACLIVVIVLLAAIGLALNTCDSRPVSTSTDSSSVPRAQAYVDENGIITRDDRLSSLPPYPDLSEDLVEQSKLGKADVIYTEPGSNPATYYYWFSENKPDDISYAVKCENGVVVDFRMSLITLKTDGWPDPFNLPEERTAPSTSHAPSTPRVDNPPDPYDYDSPEEYADNEDQWFADHGYDDPWDAAFEYWESEY